MRTHLAGRFRSAALRPTPRTKRAFRRLNLSRTSSRARRARLVEERRLALGSHWSALAFAQATSCCSAAQSVLGPGDEVAFLERASQALKPTQQAAVALRAGLRELLGATEGSGSPLVQDA